MVRASFLNIVALCLVLNSASVAAPQMQGRGLLNGYIVQVAEGVDPGPIGRVLAQRTGGTLGHVYTKALRGFSVQLPPALAKQVIARQAGVIKIEPDVRVRAVAQTLPTGVNRIDADLNSVAKINGIPEAVNVDIAIIDTGIDVDHPDLNVVGGRRFYRVFWWSREDDRYDDDNGHGSHCAGIAAARDNGTDVVGVAPGASLWAVKVLDASGAGYLSDVIAGVDWVTAHADTIEVANLSLTAMAKSDIFQSAIRKSVAAGVVYVVAAGNDGTNVYGGDGVFPSSDDTIPAAYPEVATISAMVDSDGKPGGLGPDTSRGKDDSFAGFSNYSSSVVAGNPVASPGKAIDLLMPGVNILSCWKGGGTATASGTSMASPHAAGLAALYIAQHGRAANAAGVYAIRQALIDAGMDQASGNRLAHPSTEPDGYRENLGWAGSSQTGPPTLSSVYVSPETASIEIGQTQQYTATAEYSDASEEDVTTVATWASSNMLVATVDSDGLASGHTAGTVAIRATYDGVTSDDVFLTVMDSTPYLVSILVEPQDAQIAVGETRQYLATGTYSDATTADLTTDVTWASSESSVASLDGAGLATGLTAGTTAITASYEGVTSNTATLEVSAPTGERVAQVSVTVSPLWSFGRWWVATAMVTVTENGSPLAGATVEGTWGGRYNRTVTNTTDSFGFISFETSWLRRSGTVTFTVTGVTKDGQEYALDPPEPGGTTYGP